MPFWNNPNGLQNFKTNNINRNNFYEIVNFNSEPTKNALTKLNRILQLL